MEAASFFALRGHNPNTILEASRITKNFYIATMIKEMERENERVKLLLKANPFVSIEE